MPFRAYSGPEGGSGFPRHSQSLTVLPEVGYFPDAALASTAAPRKYPPSTGTVMLCLSERSMPISKASLKIMRISIRQKEVAVVARFSLFSPFRFSIGRAALG